MKTRNVLSPLFSFLIVMIFAVIAQAQHKGINFQAVVKKPDGTYPNVSGISITAQILDPVNDCVLREEVHSGKNISNGYLNLILGDASVSTPGARNPSPVLTITEVMNNSVTRTGLKCVDEANNIVSSGQSYIPSNVDRRILRVRMNIQGEDIVADFNMRAVGFAVNSEMLNSKSDTDFINVNSAKGVDQANLESIFERFTKLDAILNNSNGSGTSLGVNITGNAATATTATSLAGGVNSLLPSQVGQSGKYLQTDGTSVSWETVAGGGGSGDITDVVAGTGLSGGGTTGSVTLSLPNVGTAGSYYKVTTDAQGRVIAGDVALIAADIPVLSTSKITTGTFADGMLAGLSIDKLINGSTKYFNYKPNNIACATGEVLKYDSTLNTSAGGWSCAPDSGIGTEADPSVALYAKNAPGNGLIVNGLNVLEIDTGVTANKIVKLEAGGKLPAVDGSQLTNLPGATSFSGSLLGDVTGTQGATVVGKLNGVGVSTALAGDDQKFMKYVHGIGWQPHFVKLSELRNVTGASSAFNVAACTAAQTLGWSSITDQFACQAINGIPAANVTGLGSLATQSAVDVTMADVTGVMPISKGGTGSATVAQNLVFIGPPSGTGAPSFRALAAADLPASAGYWTAATGGINYAGGKIGVGTPTPESKLQVSGAITTVPATFSGGFTCGSSAIDFAASNSQILSPSNTIAAGACAITLTNLVAGGTYTLVVTGNAAINAVTYSFLGYSTKFLPANTATTAGKDTIYTFVYTGSTLYVTWGGGYQ
ncbi:MAG: hypothetical protein HUU57_03950 [Bdellovibrio sp.]|nr:hypothetical protein [Bdellovibrio sp.]